MGKGDKKRPMKITKNEFDKNWDKIFNKKETKKQKWNKVNENCTINTNKFY